MPLPDDLKNYHEDSFQLVEPEIAGYLIYAALAVLLVLERLGVAVSQKQEPSILHYRALVRECGFHRALEIAAKDVDGLREELGRKLDRQSATRFAFLVAGFVLGIAICAVKGCTVVGHEKVAGWPALRVVEHYVPHAEMRDRCAHLAGFGQIVEACMGVDFARRECHIWYSADFPPQAWIVEHERLHFAQATTTSARPCCATRSRAGGKSNE